MAGLTSRRPIDTLVRLLHRTLNVLDGHFEQLKDDTAPERIVECVQLALNVHEGQQAIALPLAKFALNGLKSAVDTLKALSARLWGCLFESGVQEFVGDITVNEVEKLLIDSLSHLSGSVCCAAFWALSMRIAHTVHATSSQRPLSASVAPCALVALANKNMFVGSAARDLLCHCVVSEYHHHQEDSAATTPTCQQISDLLAESSVWIFMQNEEERSMFPRVVESSKTREKQLAMILSISERLLTGICLTPQEAVGVSKWFLSRTSLLQASQKLVAAANEEICSHVVKLFRAVARSNPEVLVGLDRPSDGDKASVGVPAHGPLYGLLGLSACLMERGMAVLFLESIFAWCPLPEEICNASLREDLLHILLTPICIALGQVCSREHIAGRFRASLQIVMTHRSSFTSCICHCLALVHELLSDVNLRTALLPCSVWLESIVGFLGVCCGNQPIGSCEPMGHCYDNERVVKAILGLLVECGRWNLARDYLLTSVSDCGAMALLVSMICNRAVSFAVSLKSLQVLSGWLSAASTKQVKTVLFCPSTRDGMNCSMSCQDGVEVPVNKVCPYKEPFYFSLTGAAHMACTAGDGLPWRTHTAQGQSEENSKESSSPEADSQKVVDGETSSLCLGAVGRMLVDYSRLALLDMRWEMRDTTLEFINDLFAHHSGLSELDKVFSSANIPAAVWQCCHDTNSYVRASAIQALASLTANHSLCSALHTSIQVTETDAVREVCSILCYDTEAFARRSAISALRVWASRQSALMNCLLQSNDLTSSNQVQKGSLHQTVCETLLCACKDFDWEVRIGVVCFWKDLLRTALDSANFGKGDNRLSVALDVVCSLSAQQCLQAALADYDDLVVAEAKQTLLWLNEVGVGDFHASICNDGGVSLPDDVLHHKRSQAVSAFVRWLADSIAQCSSSDLTNSAYFASAGFDPIAFLEDILALDKCHDNEEEHLVDCY